jgi:hypothetical protein
VGRLRRTSSEHPRRPIQITHLLAIEILAWHSFFGLTLLFAAIGFRGRGKEAQDVEPVSRSSAHRWQRRGSCSRDMVHFLLGPRFYSDFA